MDAWTVAGTLASFAGVGVGVWTLLTARGAKHAAEIASKRARARDLLEELEAAEGKVQQLGIFLMNREWSVAHLRATEIQVVCRSAPIRWPDALLEGSWNDLLRAGAIARSIAEEVHLLRIGPEELRKRKSIGKVQLRLTELVSGVLAAARMRVERGDT